MNGRQRRGAGSWPLFAGLGPMGAVSTAPGLARAFTALVLSGWGLAAMGDISALVVSELATNVVQADTTGGGGDPVYQANGRLAELWVRLMAGQGRVRIEVWDNLPPAAGVPRLRVATQEAESGRGLGLVSALSLGWGWHPVPGIGAKAVWAVLDAS